MKVIECATALIVLGMTSVFSGCAINSSRGDQVGAEQQFEELGYYAELDKAFIEDTGQIRVLTEKLVRLNSAIAQESLTREEMVYVEWAYNNPPEGFTLNWYSQGMKSHPEPILKAIIQRAGYRYVPIGTPSPGVQAVDIPEGNQTLFDIMVSVASQLGGGVRVRPLPAAAIVEVDWTFGERSEQADASREFK